MAQLIRLYELNKNTRIDVSHLNMEYEETGEPLKELDFHHVDGMYSVCKDDEGNVIHLKSTTEVMYLGAMK